MLSLRELSDLSIPPTIFKLLEDRSVFFCVLEQYLPDSNIQLNMVNGAV